MRDCTRHVGVLIVSLHIPSSQSLKDKRMVLRSMKDRVRNKFNVSVAELDDLDKWQTAVFGFTMIGNDNRYIDQCLQGILNFIETFPDIQISDHDLSFV